MKKLFVVLYLLLLVVLWKALDFAFAMGQLEATLNAQTLTVTIKPATPFQVTWDQAPEDVAGVGAQYRFWCDSAIVKNFSRAEVTAGPANADGTIPLTATVPGLTAGTKQCFVSAYTEIGESKGAAIPVTVGTLPATPLHLKIVVSVGGGK